MSEYRNLSSPEFILKGQEKRYNNSGDAHMRLCRTLVRFEGKTYFVCDSAGDNEMLFVEELNPDGVEGLQMISANDMRLDISSMDLSFVEYKGMAMYPARAPARSQKQGVDPSKCHYFDIGTQRFSPLPINNRIIKSVAGFGKYPKLEECHRNLRATERNTGSAFHKKWGLAPTRDRSVNILFHRAEAVGVFFNSENRFLLAQSVKTRSRVRALENVLSKQGGVYHVN